MCATVASLAGAARGLVHLVGVEVMVKRSSRNWFLRLLQVALCSVWAGCATQDQVDHPVPPALEQFADAARFLPPGHESYLFQAPIDEAKAKDSDLMLRPPDSWGGGCHPLIVAAGSEFVFPDGEGLFFYIGRCKGVCVIDVGAGGFRRFRSQVDDWLDIEYVSDSEGVVTLGEFSYLTLGYWPICCLVDDRFVIGASSEEELQRALARTGDIKKLVSEFPPLSNVPSDSDYVICRHPPRNAAHLGSLFEPDQDIVLSVRTLGRLLALSHRRPLNQSRSELLAKIARVAAVDSAGNGWTESTVVVEDLGTGVQSYDLSLVRNWLFGPMTKI